MRAARTALVLLSSLFLCRSSAAQAPAAHLPDTLAGRCAGAYLEAFNGEDEAALRTFFETCMVKDFPSRRPLKDAVAMTLGIRAQTGRLSLERVSTSSETLLGLLLKSEKDGWVELTFRLSTAEPGRFEGILFDEAELPGSGEARPETLSALPGAVSALLKSRWETGEFSGVVLAAVGDRVVVHECAGLADRSFAVPVTRDTKFNLGSINKLFTRIAVAQLAEKGRLSLDDTVGKILPDYPNPEVAAQVTVRHLLDFTSGMGDFFGEKFDAIPKDRLRDNRDYLSLFAADPLQFEPGTSRRYSNAGYVVLGLIVEKVSGKSYYDYIRENIYGPAGMTDTDSFEADVPVANLAEGYTRNWGGSEHAGEPPRSNIYSRPARGSSAGGGYSTAPDLFRFAGALKAGRLLGPDFTRWVLGGPEPGRPESGPGGQEPPSLVVAGGAPGIHAFLAMEGDLVVVSLANLDPPSAGNVGRKVLNWLRNVEGSSGDPVRPAGEGPKGIPPPGAGAR
ncbi:MAG: serine hydrolase domain-containing protein [Acidobacteriota bacterium]